MIVLREGTSSFGLVLLTAVLISSCLSAGSKYRWTECAPTQASFQRYFNEQDRDLDPIEGIWTEDRGWLEFVIVRDSTFEPYEFVAIALTTISPWSARDMGLVIPVSPGDLLIALRHSENDARIYEYSTVAVLRGETCTNRPCDGAFLIDVEGTLHWWTGIASHVKIDPGQGLTRKYPPP